MVACIIGFPGIAPCIHHTFGHAKAITSFLELPPLNITSSQELPRDKTYGLKYFKDIHTWLISQGPWRATFTGYDAEYKIKGTHPMGGALYAMAYTGRTCFCRYNEPIPVD